MRGYIGLADVSDCAGVEDFALLHGARHWPPDVPEGHSNATGGNESWPPGAALHGLLLLGHERSSHGGARRKGRFKLFRHPLSSNSFITSISLDYIYIEYCIRFRHSIDFKVPFKAGDGPILPTTLTRLSREPRAAGSSLSSPT